MPIEKDNKKRNWAEKIDQKEVDLYKIQDTLEIVGSNRLWGEESQKK